MSPGRCLVASKSKSAGVAVVPDEVIGDRVLTATQVAALLGVSRSKVVRRLIKGGKGPLPSFPIGRERVVLASDVKAFIEERAGRKVGV